MEEEILGYPIRMDLYPGEDKYFKTNPGVAGMAADDGSVILNPYSTLKPEEKKAVAMNEAIRLHMRDDNIVPSFGVTEDQNNFFKGTKYESAEGEKRQTIVARILSGDPSVKPTDEQRAEADKIWQRIQSKFGPTMKQLDEQRVVSGQFNALSR